MTNASFHAPILIFKSCECVEAKTNPGWVRMTGRSPVVIATGRLGRIHPCMIHDDAVGSMVGAVQVATTTTPTLARALRDALALELDRWSAIVDHDHIYQYNSARIITTEEGATNSRKRHEVHLVANRAITKDLSALLKEFGHFHTTTVRHFIQRIAYGLDGLHRVGLACGGLSLSNVFLSGSYVQVAAWFPSLESLQALDHSQSQVFADNPFVQSILRRHAGSDYNELRSRDVRSIAFMVVEMLTGSRVNFACHPRPMEDILRQLSLNSDEYRFVKDVLQHGASFQDLLTHSYFLGNVMPPNMAQIANLQSNPPCNFLPALLQKELQKCRALQRNNAQQIRGWFSQFEKKFNRKPHSDEKPPNLLRLQRQCQVFHERIEELERRIRYIGVVDIEIGQTVESVEPMHQTYASVAVLEIDTEMQSTGFNEPIVDFRRRSPAQNAFLRHA